MTLWRVERMERHPELDPDPASGAYKLVLRDADTGALVVFNDGWDITAFNTESGLINAICARYGDTYTPNDFGCE